ncbi:hypothetical protein ACOME3_003654 [Neoechinorhynchus agilis]
MVPIVEVSEEVTKQPSKLPITFSVLKEHLFDQSLNVHHRSRNGGSTYRSSMPARSMVKTDVGGSFDCIELNELTSDLDYLLSGI